MAEPKEFEVELMTMVYGGDAMGRLPDGRAVFVPYGLPGEHVRVRLTEQKKGFARGVLLEVLSESPDRVKPCCDDFTACGGCHYMHISYEAQLRYKTAILRDQFQRIAGIDSPPVQPIFPSPKEWHYRNAVQFHLTPGGRLGFQEIGSHRVIPVTECLLCEPAIEEVLPMLDFTPENPGEPLSIDRVQVRAGADGEIMLVLESDDPMPPEFTVDMPLSAVFFGPGALEENDAVTLAGDYYLVMEALERPFRVSAGSFFQVNTEQAENMVRYLLDHLPLEPSALLLEAYAGVGLFSAFLAPKVGRLVAVESAPSSIDDFSVNLDEFDNVELYDGLAEEILPGLDLQPNIILVDPPRAGLALPAIDAIVKMEAPLIAYVSCDPSTLARDAKRLLAAGYTLRSSQPFDMFPQTYHIESISIFEK